MCGRSADFPPLKEGERLDDLQRGGLMIIQHPQKFRFGTDSVLLAHHAGARRGDRICDLGTGTGVLCLLLYARQSSVTIDGVEILPDMADMARRSVALNGLKARIRIHAMDLREAPERLGKSRYSLVVCNPPYYTADSGEISGREHRARARHETATDFAEICRAASALLQHHGRFSIVMPAARCAEVMGDMQGANIEPKRIRLVQSRPEKPPKLMILTGIKGARSGLRWDAPLITHTAEGEYSQEMLAIYGDIKKDE